MPELPEVETIARGLRQALVGKTVTGVEICWERTIAAPSITEFRGQVVGQRILAVERRGKFVILRLERGSLLIHLRMTGQLLVVPAESPHSCRHVRVAIDLGDQHLLFSDSRKFGRMWWVKEEAQVLATLGPEPLDGQFSAEDFFARLRDRRGSIKSLLLNQRFLAGLGNIYADEALHAAGVAPQRPANTLSPAEATALYAAIREELERGISHRGTTLSDFRDVEGCCGEHSQHLRAYGRAGRACLRCGSTIERARIAGRSSYHCPQCQR